MNQKLRILLLAFVFFSLATNGQPSRDPAQNAALQYWRAFEWHTVPLPEGNHTNVFQLIYEGSQGNFSQQTEAFFERVKPYIERMRIGAGQPYCDWGNVPSPVAVIDLQHLSKGRSLVRLGSARFRHLVSSDREEESLALLKDAFQLSRQLDDGVFTIGIVIRNSAEAILIESAAEELPRISSDALANFQEWWEHQHWRPAPDHLSKTFRREYLHALSLYKEAAQTELMAQDLQDLSKTARENFGFPGTFSNSADLREFVEKMEKAIEMVAGALNNGDLAEAQQNLIEFGEMQDEFPLLLEVATNLLNRARSHEIRAQMFRAALAMVLEGPEVLDRYPAPHSERSFAYEPQFRDRFRLKWKDEPQARRPVRPINLQVGRLENLESATAKGDTDQVEYLLRSRVPDDRVEQFESWTALHHAAQAGLQETIKLLVQHGASINALASDRVLMDPEMAKRYGLKLPEKLGENLKTPLDFALEAGHQQLADYLRNQGGRTADELRQAEDSAVD